MARGGIYKTEVLRAREKLLAQGIYPSIDAVRTELGNTGSKSTIHRYLKEIDEEEGGTVGAKVAVSEAIQDLVGRLSGRLHEEADTQIAEAAAKHKALSAQQDQTIADLRKEAEGFRLQLERSQVALVEEQARHDQTGTSLSAETLAKTQLAQQVADLQERLASEERNRQSLEENLRHSREALEHFRQSAKEQREQEQRQHEQQVQYLQGEVRTLNQSLSEKQHEATQSSQENIRLANELAHATSKLHQVQGELRTLQHVRDELAVSARRVEELGRRVVEKESLASELSERNTVLQTQTDELRGRICDLDVELAAARATIAAQEGIAESIRAHFAAEGNKERIRVATTSDSAKPRSSKSQPGKNQETLFESGK